MLPNFFQIVNQLYAFIYETKHSKSGLGLPSIVALVMTIDKSWTTISNRNSDAFLDGLFEVIAHCKPLLHPIKEKICCPCSRCCNCDKLVTLKTLEIHISKHGFDPRYHHLTYHGESILPLPPPVPHSPEDIDMEAFFEDISANNVPTYNIQTTGPQPRSKQGGGSGESHNKRVGRERQIQRHAKGKARLGNFESSKAVVLCARSLMQQDMQKAKTELISIMIKWIEALTFCSRYLKEVETGFIVLAELTTVCLTTSVVIWLCLTTVLSRGRYLAYREEFPNRKRIFPRGLIIRDVVATCPDDVDGVVSDDDEWNLSTNMACVAPRSHGSDPPRRPTGPVPAQCQGSTIRGVTTNQALRRAFRDNREEPLTIGFDIEDQGTFHPLGVNASYLNSLMGEQIRPLPLACEWEEIPHTWYKAHILPYTLRVRLGLELKLRLLWRKRKTRIKVEHFKIHETPDDAKAHMSPPKVWDDRTQEDWEELVNWWSHPDRVARSVQNAANRAKNTIVTHQGKKPFVQGRQEYKAKKGYYEDLIETWRKGHSKKNGQFKTEENKARYEEMKAMKDHIRAGIIPFKTD
ncbi:Myc-type, basic helix-loop-helix domain-containing protein [Tanacetum coccineum]